MIFVSKKLHYSFSPPEQAEMIAEQGGWEADWRVWASDISPGILQDLQFSQKGLLLHQLSKVWTLIALFKDFQSQIFVYLWKKQTKAKQAIVD